MSILVFCHQSNSFNWHSWMKNSFNSKSASDFILCVISKLPFNQIKESEQTMNQSMKWNLIDLFKLYSITWLYLNNNNKSSLIFGIKVSPALTHTHYTLRHIDLTTRSLIPKRAEHTPKQVLYLAWKDAFLLNSNNMSLCESYLLPVTAHPVLM